MAGAVTLSGRVSSYPERPAARKGTLRVRGVTAVADDLTVDYVGAPITDTDIARSVLGILDSSAVFPQGSIQAEVRNHSVTLSHAQSAPIGLQHRRPDHERPRPKCSSGRAEHSRGRGRLRSHADGNLALMA